MLKFGWNHGGKSVEIELPTYPTLVIEKLGDFQRESHLVIFLLFARRKNVEQTSRRVNSEMRTAIKAGMMCALAML